MIATIDTAALAERLRANGLMLDGDFVEAAPNPERAQWATPIPLDDPTGPSFSLNALPDTLGAYVAAVAHQTQTPVDMAAIATLGTISAAAGGRYVVEGSGQGWIEPVHGMFVVVAEPGHRKSSVVRAVTQPISD